MPPREAPRPILVTPKRVCTLVNRVGGKRLLCRASSAQVVHDLRRRSDRCVGSFEPYQMVARYVLRRVIRAILQFSKQDAELGRAPG